MNKGTIDAITAVLGMVNPALGVIGSFVGAFGGAGSNTVVKVTSAVQDAARVVTAALPLIDSFGRGEELTMADVDAAFAGNDAAMAKLKADIARHGG